MCTYLPELYQAIDELASKKEHFDMLQIRDRIRKLTGPSKDVRFRDCKFEALTYFEQGNVPGYVLGTKTIDTYDYPQSVYEFQPVMTPEDIELNLVDAMMKERVAHLCKEVMHALGAPMGIKFNYDLLSNKATMLTNSVLSMLGDAATPNN